MKLPICFVSAFLIFVANGRGQEVRRFTVDSLRREMIEGGVGRLDFLNEPTVHASLRRFGAAGKDTARHDLVCIVAGGVARFKVGSVAGEVRRGTMLYLPKDSVVDLFDVSEPIDLMEWSSMGEMESMRMAPPAPAAFTLEEVGRQRVAGENVWNAFVRRPSMVFGLYLLPKRVGGDSALTHKWDEINLITAGSGKFQVGEKVMEVRPGDIIYVKKGNPHFFHSLKADLDILIFFEMKSMEGQ
jgi:mannose-6-phosphate isomerase-like protein (cupin superfamily)